MLLSLSALNKCFCALLSRVQKLENNPTIGVITTTTTPVYEYRDIWAEESGAVNNGSAEWSFGNGATGFIGLPIDDGWELTTLYFHADTYATTARVQVDLMNYGNVPSNAAANTLASIELINAQDGGGDTNNAYKLNELAVPLLIPSGVLGFITRVQVGNISDARVGARLRRKVADVVTSVTIS